MLTGYKHVRILISLLKQYGIKHIVTSPGSRNISIVRSVEDDPFFTCYSVVDERSAAYVAVGISLEVQSPVVLTCTSGQAGRNYLPGLTEAFYRKAQVLAVTVDFEEVYTDQLIMQSVRQMSMPTDTCNVSVDIPIIRDNNEEILVCRKINLAMDGLYRDGGGPAHINLRIGDHWISGSDDLEPYKKIERYTVFREDWPEITNKKILLVVGNHRPFSSKLKTAIDTFSEKYNVAVYVNHISNYKGAHSVSGNKVLSTSVLGELTPDIVISMGGHLGDYPLDVKLRNLKPEHWRISENGEYGDTYGSLTKVFDCPELSFFDRFNEGGSEYGTHDYYRLWDKREKQVNISSNFPLSHALVASVLSKKIPPKSIIHFAILNSLRNWEYFDLNEDVVCHGNVAGFGIDGCLSTFIGQSLVSDELNFMIIGDLSFFYDMNSIGIKHLKSNVRVILVNNGGGGEFRLNTHSADIFGDAANKHIAATGHFGDSAEGWVKNNGFEYISVRNKEDLDSATTRLVRKGDAPVLLEVFSEMIDDSTSLQIIRDENNNESSKDKMKKFLKKGIKKIV